MLLALLVTGVLAACGDDDDASSGGNGDPEAFCAHAEDVVDAMTELRDRSTTDVRVEVERVLDGFIGLAETAPDEIAEDAVVVAEPARDARERLDEVPREDVDGALSAVDYSQTSEDRESAERMETYIADRCGVTMAGS